MLVYLAVVAVFFLLYFLIPRKQAWIPFTFLVLGLAVLAFFAVPNENDDLGRYFRIIDAMRNGGWSRFQEMLDSNEFNFGALPVAGYYFYFISLFPDNHFLPFFTVLIAYGCLMNVIYKVAKRFDVDKFYLAIALFFFISTYWFYDLYSGTRNGLAFAISVACIYYHFVEKKNILLCFVGYVLAIGLQSTGIIIIVLAAFAWLSYKTSSKFVNILMIFVIAAGSVAITVLSNLTDNEFIQNLAGQTENVTDTLNISTQTNFLVNVATYLVSVLIFTYCYTYLKNYVENKGDLRFFRFAEIVLFFMLGTIVSNMLFHRVARWILPVMIACVYMVGMQIQKNRIDGKLINLYYDSDTPKAEKIRAMNKGITSFFLFAYSAVHFWYDFTGSSLIWLNVSF